LIVLSAIELAKRINYKEEFLETAITPENIYNIFEPKLRNELQETHYCVFLNIKKKIISYKEVYKGGLNSLCIHPRDIFREAIKYNSHSIILIHNHPSGDSSPSIEDIVTTNEISALGKELGINVYDHIIIGKGEYYSMKLNKKI
jgi:DNA repair protein RadC